MKQIKQIEYKTLKHAYMTVKAFLEEESGMEVDSIKTRIAEDLVMFGDDNYDLLFKFVNRFELDHKGFQYDKHFHSEGELFDSLAVLYGLLILSIRIPLKLIELLTFNKVKFDKPDYYIPDREVTDMTFKDLLIWYIEKKYISEDEIRYEIKRNTT